MRVIKTISISPELVTKAKEYNISWTEASRVGMSMLLADKGVQPYDNSLNLKRKIDALIDEVQKLHAEKKKNEVQK